jgi:hypothetical protein
MIGIALSRVNVVGVYTLKPLWNAILDARILVLRQRAAAALLGIALVSKPL